MASFNENRRVLHPAVCISSWLISALAVELAATAQLWWLAVLAAVLLVRREAARRFVRLAWKARWLWLALVLVYAWTIPGTLLWPSEYAPTVEGLQAGLTRVARLFLMLAMLARLLSEFSPRQLAGGIYLLATPLGRLGLDCRALAVRLALTLELMERPAKDRNWLDELKSSSAPAAGPDEMRLSIAQAGSRDMLILAVAAALLGVVLTRVAA